ncbi:MAG: glycosyltransferase family 2 protein [Candidatus Methanomethylicaceae archaeon]|jgi:cellulose synthase/poly-beta-1,6-N-acetylglucosamine synthase-like glycosyltransferase
MASLLLDSLSIITLLILLASFALTIYSLVIFAFGLSSYRRLRRDPSPNGANASSDPPFVLPFISLIVAVKNEEKTLSRSLEAMVSLDYPKDRYEVIVVEDGSTDSSPKLCAKFAEEHPDLVKFFHRGASKGKPSALNFALEKSRGEIIGVFDADSIPSSECLGPVISSFSSGVSALQGFTKSDAKGGFLIRLLSREHDAWFNAYMMGRKRLNLFVPFAGSCQFIRRDILERLGGWDERSLTEDMEISLRLAEAGIPVQYEPALKGKEGVPSSLGALFGQRLRWFRGWLELIIPSIPRSFGSKKLTDALFLLLTPLIFAMFPALTIIGLALSLMSLQIPVYWLQSLLYPFIMLSFLSLLIMAGVTIAYVDRVVWYKAILWIPVIFLYWGFLSATAFVSLLQALVRWPKKWSSTSKIQI